MKHSVKEMEAPLLDAAVAMAEGAVVHTEPTGKWVGSDVTYEPSEDWAQAGPIIERELISLDWHGGAREPVEWLAECGNSGSTGSTPLIAAMRAYVASKFGETIELP